MRISKTINIVFAFLLVNVLLTSCKDDEPTFISMNTTQREIIIGEQYQFKLIVQGGEKGDESVTWSVYSEGHTATDYVSIDQTGVVKAIKPSVESGVVFKITVKGMLSDGRYALAKLTTAKRNVKDELLSFEISDIYMPLVGKDSVDLKISETLIKYFPDMTVTTDKPELISPTLKLDKERVSRVFFSTNSLREEIATITLTAGDISAQCKVHIGQSLHLSFEPINISLGGIPILEQTSLSFLVNNGGKDTIKVHFLANPDDGAHLDKVEFKARAEGGNPVLLVKGQKRVSGSLLYVFIETGGQEGNSSVVIESLGKKITANIAVLDKNKLVVKKIKFKKPEMKVTTNVSLAREIVVDPISVLVHWPVQWSSSNEKIAVVDNSAQNAGQVTFKQAGVVEITGKVKDKEAVCELTALLNLYSNNIELPTKREYLVGETEILKPKLNTNFGASDRLIWSSSNPAVATVANGKIVALSAGTTTIKVSLTDDGDGVTETTKKTATAEKTITVKASTLSDIIISDQYKYYSDLVGGGIKLEVYTYVEGTPSYTFLLNYKDGEPKELANKVYTIGQEILTTSTVNSPEGILTLKSGTISVNNKKVTFNLTVQKAAATAKITGTASFDE